MSYSGFDATLACEPRVSRALLLATALAWSVPAVTALASLPAAPGTALAAMALLGAVHDLRRLAQPPRPLYWGRDGLWRRGDPEGPAHRLDPTTWSAPWLIVLVLRGPGGVARVPLARDALDAVSWRRLRARLAVEGTAAVEPR